VNERPFAFLTITINYVLHGEKVFGYHLVNFFIHFLSGLFLFYWLRLLPLVTFDESKKRWFPLVVAIFFLVHPVQTQSVTYIIQRMSTLAGLGVILSVYFYTKGRLEHIQSGNLKTGLHFYGLSLLAGIIGVLSKQNAAVFPVVLLLVEYFFIRNSEGKINKNYLITGALALVVGLIAVLFTVGLPAETTSITRFQYFATQMMVIPRYFQMMLFPIGLSIDHGVKIVDGFSNVWTVLGAMCLLAIVIYAFLMLKKEPLVSFGIFWIFITLSVESSIFPITDPMFDHRMYLPLAGFGIVLWSMVDRYLFTKKPNLIKPAIISVLLLFSVMTIARNSVWNSRVGIWKGVTEKYPDHFRGWVALGKMYLKDEEKDVPKAIEAFEKARKIAPENEENLVDLGFAYLSIRQEEKAIACYQLLANSKNQEFRQQALKVLSAYKMSRGSIDDSASYLRKLLNENPDDEATWKSLFAVYFDKKEYAKANEVAQEWLSKFPQQANASFYAGKASFFLNDKEAAARHLLNAMKIDAQHADAMMLYANVLVNTYEYDQAIALLEKAYKINNNATIPGNIELIKKLKVTSPKPQ
jgi:cytochrome c-type biogenesis protein CcmH/NrfG